MTRFKLVHVRIEEDVYRKIWAIVADRYLTHSRNLSAFVNEALKEYIRKYESRGERRRRRRT
jgi:metal-responsive CopG/Arc/MetJ family transcriptional regulator